MDLELPEATRLMRDGFLDWVKRELAPLEEEQHIDPDAGIPEALVRRVRRRSAELGYYSHHMPEAVGGAGFSMVDSVVLREAAGSTGSPLASVAIAGPEGPSPMHLLFDARQREKYLLPLVRGDTSACFMLSEPGAGSDAQAIATRAERRGDHYVLNGTKHFITNGKHADWGVVFAATDPRKRARGGISAFIVERGTYQVGRPHQGMAGFEGQTEILFEDARVPAENLVGPEGHAFPAAMQFLGTGRLQIAANCVGVAEYLLAQGTSYAKQRETFGEPLASRQGIQWMLADSATEIYAARHMCRHAAWLVDRKEEATRELSMCKLFATEMVNRVCDRVLQIHGGVGWMRGVPVERYYRQLRVLRIVEGASEIQRMIIARSVIERGH